MAEETKKPLPERLSGILVHPTSFPSPFGIGDLGEGAYRFIDFLEKAGQKLWQVLPLGHTGFGDSPYQAFSSFAGQPLVIDPKHLEGLGLLTGEDFLGMPEWDDTKVDYGPAIQFKTKLLKAAYEKFKANVNPELTAEYNAFVEKTEWLADYALFMAAKDYHDGRSWLEWNDEFSNPNKTQKKALAKQLEDGVGYYQFIQFMFFKEWFSLKEYANNKGIKIIGDIPIFVSIDSADVWANKELFQLTKEGFPVVVAGVPPDYFSETGQLWGNPLYKWETHKKKGYSWWIERLKVQLEVTDYLRIDHFRGFDTYWAVPYGEETAINGEWKKGPGPDLFVAIEAALGKLPIIAEDLGDITQDVIDLRDQFEFPGMKILQFAFDGEENDFLPHYHGYNSVCYPGTHDNDTVLGWYKAAPEKTKDIVRRYLNTDGNNISWDLIRACFASPAKYAIVPIQDVFSLDENSRMNIPGTSGGICWAFRYRKEYLSDFLADRLKSVTELYGR